MIVYAISDLHGNLPAVPRDAEVVLLAGDICPDFRPTQPNRWDVADKGGERQAAWLDTIFRSWLYERPGVTFIATWGNHDFVGEHPGLVPDLPWHLLVDDVAFVKRGDESLAVYGTPWVPGLPYWAFYGDDRKLKLRADAIPHELDVLMTHGPPQYFGDYIPTSEKQRNKYGNFGGEHVGDPTLNTAICRALPGCVVCGHIHEARGDYVYGGIGVHNVAAVDENYALHRNPFVRLEFGL